MTLTLSSWANIHMRMWFPITDEMTWTRDIWTDTAQLALCSVLFCSALPDSFAPNRFDCMFRSVPFRSEKLKKTFWCLRHKCTYIVISLYMCMLVREIVGICKIFSILNVHNLNNGNSCVYWYVNGMSWPFHIPMP